MIRVILESPFDASERRTVEENETYARRCTADSMRRGEAPQVSHLLYTQPGVLNDRDPVQRKLGIRAGHAWYSVADRCVVYMDHGISDGMRAGIEIADRFNVQIRYRNIL